jgi:hypothetical protein
MNWPLVWKVAEAVLELLGEMKAEPALDTYRTEKTIDELATDIAGYRATWDTIKKHQIECPTCKGAGVLVPGPRPEPPPE